MCDSVCMGGVGCVIVFVWVGWGVIVFVWEGCDSVCVGGVGYDSVCVGGVPGKCVGAG